MPGVFTPVFVGLGIMLRRVVGMNIHRVDTAINLRRRLKFLGGEVISTPPPFLPPLIKAKLEHFNGGHIFLQNSKICTYNF